MTDNRQIIIYTDESRHPEFIGFDETPRSQTPVGIYLASLAPSSRQTMFFALSSIGKMITRADQVDVFTIPFHELKYSQLVQIRAMMNERFSPNTANLYLSALRGVLKEAWRMELITHEEYRRRADIPSVIGELIPKGRSLTVPEIRQLLDHIRASDNPTTVRDGAMAVIGMTCGLRRNEMISLDITDFTEIEVDGEPVREVAVRHGKRRKARVVFINSSVFDILDRWLEIRGDAPGLFFSRLNTLPRISRLSDQTVLDGMVRLAERAGIQTFRPHDLRRTFATRLLDLGVDIFLISRLMGHSDIGTTQKYDKRHVEQMASASLILSTDFARLADDKTPGNDS